MLLDCRSGAALIGVLAALATLAHNGAALSGWAFLADQTDCRLSCQNGGVCAFDRDAPHRHKCICFVGMFYGERCEFVVSSEDPNNSAASSSLEEEATANGALKAGISTPNQEALAPLDDSDVPYEDPAAGFGGSLDAVVDAVIPDTVGKQTAAAAQQKNAALEEQSYDSEPVEPSATSPIPPADEVELLRNEATQPYGRDAYSRLDLDDVPTSATASREDEHNNVLAPPDTVTTPLAVWHSGEEQQPKQMEQYKDSQEQIPLDTAGTSDMEPADAMGGSFLTANDEFHAAPNVKHYEEHPRSTQSHYAPSEPIDTVAPTTSMPTARRKKTRQKHYRGRATTAPAPADSDGNGEDVDEDDGWMISAKGRRQTKAAPSAATVPTRFGLAAFVAVAIAMAFCRISEHWFRQVSWILGG